nr:hypothetical protein [Mesorhizobium ciceri]
MRGIDGRHIVGRYRQLGVDALQVDDSLLGHVLYGAQSRHGIGQFLLGKPVELGIGHHQLAIGEGAAVGLDLD